MSTDFQFQPLAYARNTVGVTVTVSFNGGALQVPVASSVAAALLGAGVKQFRHSPVSGANRAPYCMMGVCFECLVEIDGVPNRQSCMVPLRPGMMIRTHEGSRGGTLGASDPAIALAQAMEAGNAS